MIPDLVRKPITPVNNTDGYRARSSNVCRPKKQDGDGVMARHLGNRNNSTRSRRRFLDPSG